MGLWVSGFMVKEHGAIAKNDVINKQYHSTLCQYLVYQGVTSLANCKSQFRFTTILSRISP